MPTAVFEIIRQLTASGQASTGVFQFDPAFLSFIDLCFAIVHAPPNQRRNPMLDVSWIATVIKALGKAINQPDARPVAPNSSPGVRRDRPAILLLHNKFRHPNAPPLCEIFGLLGRETPTGARPEPGLLSLAG
jgi:hypothetical protein